MGTIINYRKFFRAFVEVKVENCGLCACRKVKKLDDLFFLCFIKGNSHFRMFLIHVVDQTTVLSL